MVWLRLEKVADDLELTVNCRLIPSVALIAIDEHVGVRRTNDPFAQSVHVNESLLPARIYQSGSGTRGEEIDPGAGSP
jgi:hypothetical protein